MGDLSSLGHSTMNLSLGDRSEVTSTRATAPDCLGFGHLCCYGFDVPKHYGARPSTEC
jgi:hypothetical protein